MYFNDSQLLKCITSPSLKNNHHKPAQTIGVINPFLTLCVHLNKSRSYPRPRHVVIFNGHVSPYPLLIPITKLPPHTQINWMNKSYLFFYWLIKVDNMSISSLYTFILARLNQSIPVPNSTRAVNQPWLKRVNFFHRFHNHNYFIITKLNIPVNYCFWSEETLRTEELIGRKL